MSASSYSSTDSKRVFLVSTQGSNFQELAWRIQSRWIWWKMRGVLLTFPFVLLRMMWSSLGLRVQLEKKSTERCHNGNFLFGGSSGQSVVYEMGSGLGATIFEKIGIASLNLKLSVFEVPLSILYKGPQSLYSALLHTPNISKSILFSFWSLFRPYFIHISIQISRNLDCKRLQFCKFCLVLESYVQFKKNPCVLSYEDLNGFS